MLNSWLILDKFGNVGFIYCVLKYLNFVVLLVFVLLKVLLIG